MTSKAGRYQRGVLSSSSRGAAAIRCRGSRVAVPGWSARACHGCSRKVMVSEVASPALVARLTRLCAAYESPRPGYRAGRAMLVLSGLVSATDRERADMSLFQRAHDIVAAKADKALDAAEKPDEMLDYSYNQMLEQITRIRRALVDIAASRKQIELQETQLQHSIDHLNDQAKTALGQGREDLAREALSRKGAAQAQIDSLEPQHQQLTEEEEKLEHGLAELQKRVNNFRSQKEVLKAQYTAASAISAVNEDAAGISTSVSDSGAALERAQDKISTMQARAGALDELTSSSDVDNELAALKAQLGQGTPPPPALPAG